MTDISRRTVWSVTILLIVALFVRAAFLVFVAGVDAPLTGDQGSYHAIAVSFLEGKGWKDPAGLRSYRPPLISLQLVGLYSLVGPDARLARWYMVLISSLVAPLVFLVARFLLSHGEKACFLAGLAWCLYPPSVFFSARILTENAATLLVLVGLGSMLWAARTRTWWGAAITGVVWGLTALNRPVYLLLPLALLAIQTALGHRLSWYWSRSQWGVALIAVAAALAPWTLRNYLIHGVFMPGTSMAGRLLVASNVPLTHPAIRAGMYFEGEESQFLARQPEATWNSLGLELALNHIRRNLPLLPRPLLNRALNFWTPRTNPYDPSWHRTDWVMLVIWVPVLILFVYSFRFWSWHNDWAALVMILYAFVFTLPFWGTPRFRFPVDPLIMSRAMVGLDILVVRARQRLPWRYKAPRRLKWVRGESSACPR